MNEIEAKLIEINQKTIENKLLEIGAEKVFEGELLMIYYESPNLNKNQVLRLRKEAEKTVLTYKNKISYKGTKNMEETEVFVSDFETMREILLKVGFKEKGIIRKYRISYVLKGVKFEIDKYQDDLDHIPTFLEIEAKTEEEVYKNAELLGFEKKDLKPWSVPELKQYYSK